MEEVERESRQSIEHNLIILDSESGLPVFNPEARTIAEFRELIAGCSRSKNVSGTDAKKKATAKMAGVFFFSSYLSVYYGKDDFKKRKEIAKQVTYLELDDMTRDDFIAACKRFQDLEYVPAVEALVELHAALAFSLKFVKRIRKSLEITLEDDERELTVEETDLVMTQINKLVDLASKIPETQMKVEQALAQVKKQYESKKYRKRKGGKEIHPREV